ncbi:MAG TPA: hypothetical protein VJ801_11620 [Polyangia bacterium]|jgi:hypothetical protein|nr:hypothetical protein [Polyangia bacterium]
MSRSAIAVLLSFAALGAGLGCGSSNSKEADTSVPDLAPATPDLRPADSGAPDAWLSPDSATDSLAVPDANVFPDVSVTSDLQGSPDLSSLDLVVAGADRSAADLGAPDQGGVDAGGKDTSGAEVGGDAAGGDNAASPADATSPPDAAFDPGPTIPIVVNSGNTATYNLADGKWKRFSFPVEAGQIYAISELSGIVRGYVSAQATVSPSNSTYSTDVTTGRLVFTASAAGTYYIAVAVVGGGASGSFQVADGGKLVALGATSLTLTAPNAEDFYFFRFPVAAGKGYHLKVTGPIQPNVGLAVSARAERSNYGEFAYSDFGVAGSLSFDEDITAAMVAMSISGYYYFYLNLHGDMTLTVTISELP